MDGTRIFLFSHIYHTFMKKLFLVVFITLIGVVASISQTITPEIISDIRHVTEVSVSPNGNDIAYILRVPGNDASGMQKSVLMTVPKAGGASKIILEKVYNPSSISWSKDGRNIYCLIKDSVKKVAHLNIVQLANKDVTALTSGTRSVGHYAFSPDEKMLALIYTDAQNEVEKVDEKRKRDWIVKDENLKYDRLYVTDATVSYTPKDISDKILHVTDFIWSPDGKMIYFKACEKTSVDHTMMYQKIYRVSAEGGSPEVVCETEGKLGNIDVSPDGKNLAFCGAV
ncbi:MAG: hypothetical protein EPN85_07170, partial [Bacteroidetes bacterium]